jgi:CheY-like chemotaxis protein
MMHGPWRVLIPLALLLALTSVGTSFAQEAKEKAPETPAEPKKLGLAAQTVLDLNPQTPAEMLRAAITLLDLGATQEAKSFLAKLEQSKLDDAALAELVHKFGSGELLRLSANPALEAKDKQFVASMFAAADKQSRDPARLDRLVGGLQSSEPAARRAAIVDLRTAKTGAVTHLLAVLADPRRAKEHSQVKYAISQMGSMAVGPLLGALEASDERLKSDVIDLLGAMRSQAAVMELAGLAATSESERVRDAAWRATQQIVGAPATPEEAGQALYRQVKRYFSRVRPFEPDHEGMVRLWGWDDQQGESTSQKFPADDAAILMAARLTPYLYAIEPRRAEYRQLHFTAQLEAAKMRRGYAKPLPPDGEARTAAKQALSVPELERLLQFAAAERYFGAAAAACEILGDAATAAILTRPDGGLSPLTEALEQGDRRLRFAALEAIMKLAPPRPYAGASRAAETLGYFVATAGAPRVAIAHPRLTTLQDLAAMLAGLGYEPEIATDGRRLIDAANDSADFEMVFVDSGIRHPPLREVIYRLRRDPRTAHLPIGIMATADNLERKKDLAASHPRVVAFPEPQEAEGFAHALEQLQAAQGRGGIDSRERLEQAAKALQWIGELAAEESTYYDVRRLGPPVRAALHVPELTAKAATVLGRLGTPDAQRALAALAGRAIGPVEDRRAAADKATQQLRASILDTLEAPAKQRARRAEQAQLKAG